MLKAKLLFTSVEMHRSEGEEPNKATQLDWAVASELCSS